MHATSHPGGVGCRRIDLCNNNNNNNSSSSSSNNNNNNTTNNTNGIKDASDLSWHADLRKEGDDVKIGSKDQCKTSDLDNFRTARVSYVTLTSSEFFL